METILIIESNMKLLQQLVGSIYAECLDIQLLTATTYEEGQAIIDMHHIDIAVMDINLTDSNDGLGLELAKYYRARYPYNTIIFQTMYDDYGFRDKLYDHIGMHIYLLKNKININVFISVVKHELGRFKVQFVNKIFIYQRDKKIPIDANEILYLEKVTETKDIKLFIFDKHEQKVKIELLSNLSLDKLLKLPGTRNLFRCHKSYIVNKQMIVKSVIIDEDGDSFQLRYTDELVPIGRKFRKESAKMLQGISM